MGGTEPPRERGDWKGMALPRNGSSGEYYPDYLRARSDDDDDLSTEARKTHLQSFSNERIANGLSMVPLQERARSELPISSLSVGSRPMDSPRTTPFIRQLYTAPGTLHYANGFGSGLWQIPTELPITTRSGDFQAIASSQHVTAQSVYPYSGDNRYIQSYAPQHLTQPHHLPDSLVVQHNGQGQHESIMLSNFIAYKLQTEVYRDYVIHRREPTTGRGEESVWDEQWEIGRGGAGSVWCQKNRAGGQLRAVKIILRPQTGFPQELLALVELKDYDQFFVKFIGWYEDIRSMFLVMEYISGGDLGKYIREYPNARENAKEITRQILGGLEVLHEKRIYHRDIKPQNILVASFDPIWVKIADFGVAKQTIDTTARSGWGTDCYRPPETMGIICWNPNKPKFPAYALDIWPLGSLVHELLTSRTPFTTITTTTTTTEEYDQISGIADVPQRTFLITSLMNYCNGSMEFPVEDLQQSHVSEAGIAFVKKLLAPNIQTDQLQL